MSRSNVVPAKISAHPTALIAQDTNLQGEIIVGAGVIMHPKASILAIGGPISIGENCMIEENVVILNRSNEMLEIGSNNHFMIGCRIESPSIGNDNTFHARCAASSEVAITNHCTLAAGVVLLPQNPTSAEKEVLPDHTVVYGELSERRIWDMSGAAAEKAVRDGEREYLREILPKYNKMRALAQS